MLQGVQASKFSFIFLYLKNNGIYLKIQTEDTTLTFLNYAEMIRFEWQYYIFMCDVIKIYSMMPFVALGSRPHWARKFYLAIIMVKEFPTLFSIK